MPAGTFARGPFVAGLVERTERAPHLRAWRYAFQVADER
jgi:hypothetical protein